MPHVKVSESAILRLPAKAAYSILADYDRGHRQILPKRYFESLEIEQGGVGAGTRFRTVIRAYGSRRTYRMEVSEPEPGRVLAETDLDNGTRTTFSVEPQPDAATCRVTLATEYDAPGLVGWLESLFAPLAVRRIYAEELANLERVGLAAAKSPATA